ncbi:MAG: UDP-N-acetylmuramoyl-L-alanine--D-glutamate ligase [Bacteroidota bacterium]
MSQKVAVLGLGIENLALVKYLAARRFKITVCDNRTQAALGARYEMLQKLGVTFHLGPDYLSNLEEFDQLYRSPGLPLFQPELIQAAANGVKITSAMRLFLELCPCPIIGVTGSKGKGTTSTLIYQVLKLHQESMGRRAYLGGNIGIAPFEFIEDLQPEDRVVLELSSFQLEDFDRSVNIGVITNITEDHLAPADPLNPNYHKSRPEYIRAKTNLFRHQKSEELTILNVDDPTSSELIPEVPGRLYTYGSAPQALGAWFCRQQNRVYSIWWNVTGKPDLVIESNSIQVRGEHNLLNIAAAALACHAAGAGLDSIRQGISGYTGLEHRLEYVATINGIQFFDDSFATAPDPTIVALKAFTEPIVLIAGGADKGSDYTSLGEEIVKSSVKTAVLIGTMGPKIGTAISQAAERLGKPVPKMVEGGVTMKEIFAKVMANANAGDVVLLSTACASFGLFKNYKERGDLFKAEVRRLTVN